MYNNAVFRQNSGEETVDFYLKSYHHENGNTAYEKRDYDFIDPAILESSQLEIDKYNRIIGVKNPDSALRLPLEQRLCPYCHNNLIKKFGMYEARYIAIVGVPNSGKTTMLAAINAALRNKAWRWGSLDSEASRPLDDITEKYCRNETSARTATKSIQGPYFYKLNCANIAKSFSNSEQHIVFLDIPGEIYMNANRIGRSLAKYLEKADGVIFVIDSAEAISNTIRINNILDAFDQTGIASNKKVAIVFNKFDKITEPLGISDALAMNLPPKKTDGPIDTYAIKEQSKSIVSLMLGQGANIKNQAQVSLANCMNKIQLVFGKDDSCVFTTRLLVENSDDTFIFKYDGAETPFLWLLSEMNAFPKTPNKK